MNEMITWLRAQHDEDERLARAASWELATGDRWSVWRGSQPYERPCIVVDHLGDGVADIAPENGDADGVAEHIVRHDPERVLADVAAKRAIVDEYAEATARQEQLYREWSGLVETPRDRKTTDMLAKQARLKDGLRLIEGRLMALGTVTRHLASAYADRPGYREEWRA